MSNLLTIEKIKDRVVKYFDMPEGEIDLKTRRREIVYKRQICYYFGKLLTKDSLAYMGIIVGNKDHATVLHGFKTISNLYDTDKKTRIIIDELDAKFKHLKIYGIKKANKLRSKRHVKVIVIAHIWDFDRVFALVDQIVEIEKEIDKILGNFKK